LQIMSDIFVFPVDPSLFLGGGFRLANRESRSSDFFDPPGRVLVQQARNQCRIWQPLGGPSAAIRRTARSPTCPLLTRSCSRGRTARRSRAGSCHSSSHRSRSPAWANGSLVGRGPQTFASSFLRPRRITVSRSLTAIGSKPRASYIERGPRK